MRVYGDVQSGNCYKVKLLMALLQIEHQWQAVDILAGDTKTPEFLAKNANGKIPLIELDDGRLLAESNAILGYFAADTALMPSDKFQQAKVYEWLFFEQYSHEPFIAVARFIQHYLGMPAARQAEYESLQAGGNKALSIMEQQLTQTDFLVGNSLTIADISLYAYTHVAGQGGFDLTRYLHVQAWCQRIAQQPHYVALG